MLVVSPARRITRKKTKTNDEDNNKTRIFVDLVAQCVLSSVISQFSLEKRDDACEDVHTHCFIRVYYQLDYWMMQFESFDWLSHHLIGYEPL